MKNLAKKIPFVLSAALFAAVGNKVMAERNQIDLLDAAEVNNAALASYLIEQGADLEKRSYFFDLTPLATAFDKGAIEVATTLICAGADLQPHSNWSHGMKGSAMQAFAEQSVEGAKLYYAASDDKDSFKDNYCPAYDDGQNKKKSTPFASNGAQGIKPTAYMM